MLDTFLNGSSTQSNVLDGSVRPASRALRAGGLALVFAMTGLAGCAPTDEDEGESQDSAYTLKTCGVGPNDRAIAASLNAKMRGRFANAMNAERVACARKVVQTALPRVGDYGAQIAIATTMVETNIDNITVAVDYDSLGLFQQRPSQGWGRRDQLIDPVYATNAFINAMIRTYGDSWKNRPLGTVAQGVQRSAFPSRYANDADNAKLIVAALRGSVGCPGATGTTTGAIDAKWQALGGCNSILGAPITNEGPTVSRGGRYNHFQRGSIYWTEQTGAHEIHGNIRDLWEQFQWEAGPLGYPLTDELKSPDNVGKYEVFEGGSIYWTDGTGAHEVRGAIRDKWAELGWELGKLGYPTKGEETVDVGADKGIKTQFQHGSIIWNSRTRELTVAIDGEAPAPAPAPAPAGDE